jgi:hypothetical protein
MRVEAGMPEAWSIMRVLLEGEDVTHRCIAFDTNPGLTLMGHADLLVEKNGLFQIDEDTNELVWERVYGRVIVERREVA